MRRGQHLLRAAASRTAAADGRFTDSKEVFSWSFRNSVDKVVDQSRSEVIPTVHGQIKLEIYTEVCQNKCS